jgi:hypothetical protein
MFALYLYEQQHLHKWAFNNRQIAIKIDNNHQSA